MQSLQRFFSNELTFNVMLQRIKEMMRLLPTVMARIIKFACLIGLRPAEVVESIRLLNSSLHGDCNYYNPERQALEHFRFPQFLRQTKKAYLSFVTPSMLSIVQNLEKVPTYNAIRLACYYRGIKCDMRFCRKIFASWLRKEGIQPEVVDMLQGRVSQSVLTRHYLTPDSNLSSRVLDSLSRQA
jgi:intergrase/recombinase